jgi:hypothetical protein
MLLTMVNDRLSQTLAQLNLLLLLLFAGGGAVCC